MFGSLAVFGGGTAAVTRRFRDNSIVADLIGPAHESDKIIDAVPVSNSGQPAFVMLRTLTHPVPGTPEARGPNVPWTHINVLEWLTISPRP